MEVLVEEYDNSMYYDVLDLELKEGDKLEFEDTNIDIITYLNWHLDVHYDNTHVIKVNNKIIGICGINQEGIAYTMTEELSNSMKITFARRMLDVINYLMDKEGHDIVKALVYKKYKKSVRWQKLNGFKEIDNVGDYVTMEYKKSDNLSLLNKE